MRLDELNSQTGLSDTTATDNDELVLAQELHLYISFRSLESSPTFILRPERASYLGGHCDCVDSNFLDLIRMVKTAGSGVQLDRCNFR